MASTPSSASVHIDGSMGLLRERVNGQPQQETRSLLQHLLSYAESQHLTANSSRQDDAQYGCIRMNLGLVRDSRVSAEFPDSLLGCQLVLNVKKSHGLGEVLPPQPPYSPPSRPVVGLGTDAQSVAAHGPSDYLLHHRLEMDDPHLNEYINSLARYSPTPHQDPSPQFRMQHFRSSHPPDQMLSTEIRGLFAMQHQTSLEEVSSGGRYHSLLSRSVSVNTNPALSMDAPAQSSSSYASYESLGQASQRGSRWPGGLSPNRNSGFASGAQSSVPKEGYETRREPGTVGRTGNGPRDVPPSLAAAARSQQTIQFTPGPRADLHTQPQTGADFVARHDFDSKWDPFYPPDLEHRPYAKIEAMANNLPSEFRPSRDSHAVNDDKVGFDPTAVPNAKDAGSVIDPELATEPKLLPIIDESGEDAEDSIMADGDAVSPEKNKPRTSDDHNAANLTTSNASAPNVELSANISGVRESPGASPRRRRRWSQRNGNRFYWTKRLSGGARVTKKKSKADRRRTVH